MCGFLGYKGTSVGRDELSRAFSRIEHRGPDDTKERQISGDVFFGFHRLAIMDLSHAGDQPFVSKSGEQYLMCNGEIYNYLDLEARFPDYTFSSKSDCEALIPMLLEYGMEHTCKELDAEFAFVFYDEVSGKLMAARDPIGIRPLFWGLTKEGERAFASEVKALESFCETVEPFPPGHYFDGDSLKPYRSITGQLKNTSLDFEKAVEGIRTGLEQGVVKRLQSDAPLGFLLSGGLDSSLVCAIAARYLNKPIKTFSIGSVYDAIDNKYAEQVADYIGADHTTVTFDKEEAISALSAVIESLETWDVTTVRASVGMYLVCKFIREHTDIKVLLTGEVSDELFGYKYTDFAPSPEEFQEESRKRVRELHYYDVLRADRCISAHSLEARVPFGDLSFVDHVMSIPAKLKMNTYGHGKYLLRKAFEQGEYLPRDILFREKAAFSDAVGHSLVDDLKEFASRQVSDTEFSSRKEKYPHGCPKTKEAFLYRKIFESKFPGRAELIPSLWLPNTSWENCNVTDPSARVLPNYGKSGS